MTNMDNVASRLHSVLEQAARAPGDISIKTAWKYAFGIESADLVLVYRNIFLLHQLLDELERQIKSIPNISHDLYLKSIPNIRQVLSLPNLNEAWSGHKHLLNAGVLGSLEFCAERLSNVRPEKVPPDEEIEALKQAVEELREQVLSGGLNHELQFLLLDLLESMRRALYEYRFRGVSGLRQELFSILERLQKYSPIIKQHSEEPVVHSFWNILTRFDVLTSNCLNIPQILGGISKLLGSG